MANGSHGFERQDIRTNGVLPGLMNTAQIHAYVSKGCGGDSEALRDAFRDGFNIK